MTSSSTGTTNAVFDGLAEDYDHSFTNTPLGRLLREAVWRRMEIRFDGLQRIIEIGCGTGEDAIHLARRGHSVLSTDESSAMIDAARTKAEHAGCAGQIEFRRIPMDDLASELAGARFDACFSNFGAVNCAIDIARLIADIDGLLKRRAALLWVVMGRHVPWEWGWFLARGNPRKALRRFGRGGSAWRGIRVNYPTPRELTAALGRHFTDFHRQPLGLILPPTYAANWLNRRPRLLTAMARAEGAVSGFQPLAALADHYIIEAHRDASRSGA